MPCARPQSASLRTTLAISALTLISDLFTFLPAALVDPLVDPFLTHVLSMSGMTKKIVATASQHTATVVLTHAPFHPRAVHLVAQLGSEKTPQARLFGAQHVLTVLRVHGANPALSSSASTSSSASAGPSAADELERAVSRALADPNAQVREQAREAYWELVRLGGPWTERAERVRALLDTTAKKLLDKARPAEVSAPAQQAAGAGASTVAGGSARRAGPGAAAGARRTGGEGPSGAAGPSPAAGAGAAGAGPKKMSVKDMLAAKRREALAAKERGDGGDLLDEGVVLTPTRRSSARDGAVESSPAESATPQETPTRPQATQHSPPASPSPAAAAASAARPPAFASPPPHTPARPSPASASASRSLVPDHVVDDALREQALQAEQAAERLLELAEDEADAASAPAPSTSSSSAPPAASTPARAPPSTAAAGPAAGAALRTPAPNPALRRLNGAGAASSVFADSPDARDPLGATTSGSWWLKRGEALGAPSSSSSSAAPAREPDSAARREEIDALVERVARCGSGRDGGEVDAAGWREVGRLAREWPVRDGEGGEAGEGAAEDGENARFWRDEARFERVFEGVRGFLLREQGAAQVLLLLSLTHFSSFPRPRLCEPR